MAQKHDADQIQVDGDDDDLVALSSSTLNILNQFLSEQTRSAEEANNNLFAENWGMSQFWYTEETATRVAEECVRVAEGGAIACVACPSLFRKLQEKYPLQHIHLFEYDTRFEILGNFSFYDYNEPFRIKEHLKGAFKVVVIDPPYLSKECFEKSIQSMRALGDESSSPCYLALTGATLRDTAKELLNLRPVLWRPEHRNKLGNEFCLYTRDQSTAEGFGGWDELH